MKQTIFAIISLLMLYLSCELHAQSVILKVVAEGTGDPLVCKVVLVAPDEKETKLGATDATGQLKISQPCATAAVLLVQPLDRFLYYSEDIPCSEAGVKPVILQKVTQPTVRDLAQRLSWDLVHPTIEEAVVSNRIANELKATSHGASYTLYRELIFAKMLEVKQPFSLDEATQQLVLSTLFKQRITALQSGLGLQQTGVLDAGTLSAAQNIVRKEGPEVLGPTMDAGAKRIKPSH